MTTPSAPKKYTGRCAWLFKGDDDSQEGEVKDAIDRGHEFVLDVVTDGKDNYTVTLRRQNTPKGDLLGTFEGAATGRVSARIYVRGDDLVLVGTWEDLPDRGSWWVELIAV